MTEPPNNFVEHAGAAWKRLEDGTVESTPYCPKCHKALVSRLSYQHLSCPACGLLSSFKKGELRTVLNEIPKSRVESPAQFFQHDGIAWKRQRHGTLEMMPYCASCFVPLTTNRRFENFSCPQCGSEIALQYGDLPEAWANAERSMDKGETRLGTPEN